MPEEIRETTKEDLKGLFTFSHTRTHFRCLPHVLALATFDHQHRVLVQEGLRRRLAKIAKALLVSSRLAIVQALLHHRRLTRAGHRASVLQVRQHRALATRWSTFHRFRALATETQPLANGAHQRDALLLLRAFGVCGQRGRQGGVSWFVVASVLLLQLGEVTLEGGERRGVDIVASCWEKINKMKLAKKF